ncbi:sensor histidine kinase [Jannaschia sp. R86511]|uniref:sensor histidine kinase n=1 Tax=Jannaschia sp. R86511 TaxID=3093853 RepID=UPI0036D36F98
MVGAVPTVYRGPDRRRRHEPARGAGPVPVPAARPGDGHGGSGVRGEGDARASTARPVARPATVLPALLLVVLLALVALPDPVAAALLQLPGRLLQHPSAAVLLHHLSEVVLLGAGVAGLLRWRLDGRAPDGLVAAALLVLGGASTLVGRVEDLVLPAEVPSVASPLLVALLTAAVVVAATCSVEVDSGLRPVRVVGWTVLAALATAGLAAGAAAVALSRVPVEQLPALASAVWSASAVVWFAVAGRTLLRPGALGRSWSVALTVLLLGAALGAAGRGVAHLLPGPDAAAVAATVLHLLVLTGSVLVGRRAALDTGRALEAVSRRERELSLRLAADERVLRDHAENLHDARSSVAGIRSAAAALDRLAERLEPADRAGLEAGVRAELCRLERLLASATEAPAAVTAVDDAVRPLVVMHRERGQRLEWEPSGTHVALAADDLARAVANLLGNALVHAPRATVRLSAAPSGSQVRITVEDDGPGVPAALRERVFGAGVRAGAGAGQGLGLPVVRRLARAAGGDCRLVGARGARFVLDLPAAGPRQAVTAPAVPVPAARGAG